MDRAENKRDEYLEIVNQQGKILGLAKRSECHSDPSLIHRVSHVLVFNQDGLILLQKRAMNKDIQPGKWDTSVGGHLDIGEDFEQAAYREMMEELGIMDVPIHFLYQYLWSTERETELVKTFYCIFDGQIIYNKEEIDQIGFWTINDLLAQMNDQVFTPNLKEELSRYLSYRKL